MACNGSKKGRECTTTLCMLCPTCPSRGGCYSYSTFGAQFGQLFQTSEKMVVHIYSHFLRNPCPYVPSFSFFFSRLLGGRIVGLWECGFAGVWGCGAVRCWGCGVITLFGHVKIH